MISAGLLERGDVVGSVVRSLDGARAGRGSVLFIVGEAGLGKTSVLKLACDAARADMDVAMARADAIEQAVPFGLVEQALSAVGVGEALRPGGSVIEPSAPFYRVLRALRDRDERPTLMAFDDLHFADGDSLRLIAFLVRRLSSLPLALIGALRPWPAEPEELCRSLAEDGAADITRLAPLSRASVEVMLAERLGAAVGPTTVARAWELCSGNPLLLEQIGAAVAQGEELPDLRGSARGLGRHIVLSRFAGLGPAGLACARAASVLGADFPAELPAAVAGLDDVVLDEALFRSGILVESEAGGVRFAHPLFAQALYEDLDPAGRRRLHARAFTILADRGLDAEAGEHAVLADLRGNERAVATLERAGRDAMAAGAVATAARHLDAAVRLSSHRVRPELRRELCEALVACGRIDEAVGVSQRLLAEDGLDWRERLAVLRIHGRALYLLGASDHGDGALAEAAALAVAHDAPGLAVGPLLDQSLSAWLEGGPAGALPLARRAKQLARAANDSDLSLRAGAAWGHLAVEAGDTTGFQATMAVERNVANRTMAIDPAELAWPWASVYHAAMDANYAERYGDAERIFKRARSVMEQAGAPTALATLSIYIASNVLRQGRIEEGLTEAVRAREFAELTPGVVAYADAMQAEVLAWAGRLKESEMLCARAEQSAPEQWFVRLWVAHVRGMLLLWQGDDQAAGQFLIADEVTRAVGIREPCHLQWQGHAIAAHLAANRTDDAQRVIDWLESCARSLPCRWPRIAATLGRAQLAAREGDLDAADTMFRTAMALHAETELPLHRVEALLAYGAFLRRTGHPTDARPLLADAQLTAVRTGAGRLAETAHSELALAGGRRRGALTDRDELTAAEVRVAELAAAGRSNAEIARQLFLSVNTVETHLKHVYAKLRIRSRRDLMARRTDPESALG